jgi:hypothetical protein
MKKLLFVALLYCLSSACFAQTSLISYEDVDYLFHNNLNKADTFLLAKGYNLAKKNEKKNIRKYTLAIPGGTYVNFNLRSDGKRLFAEMETNEPAQYNMIYNFISQFAN